MRLTLPRLMAAAFALGVCHTTQGCAVVHAAQRLATEPVSRFEPPSVSIPSPSPGECAGPLDLAPGESRPCRSVSVPAGYLVALQAAVEQARTMTEPALDECYAGRDADRANAAEVVDGLADALKVCRQRHAATFAAGAAAGALTAGGACVAGQVAR